MRLLTLFCLLAVGLGGVKKNGKTADELNGVWIPVKQELGGKQLPNNFFEKQKLIISYGTYTVTAESLDKGDVSYADGKMNIYGKEGVNTGKHFTAIYELKNDQLTICYNLAGDGYPEAFETKGKPKFFLSVFKKG